MPQGSVTEQDCGQNCPVAAKSAHSGAIAALRQHADGHRPAQMSGIKTTMPHAANPEQSSPRGYVIEFLNSNSSTSSRCEAM